MNKKKETLHIYTRVSTTSQSEKGMSLINQSSVDVNKSPQRKPPTNMRNTNFPKRTMGLN